MPATKIELTKDKETKGTVRFAAQDEDAPIQTVYIRKGSDLLKSDPASIELSVTAA